MDKRESISIKRVEDEKREAGRGRVGLKTQVSGTATSVTSISQYSDFIHCDID